MKDKKGFTLVELLAVVVIMGIIIGISIPAVTAVQKRLVKQRITTFYRIVDESVDAYVEQYHTDFEKTRDCFEISYKDLIDQELLKETNITCLSEAYTGVEGKIIATRVNGGETFTYTHYLTCYDKETDKPLSKSEPLPEGCIGIRGGFSLDVKAIHVKKGGGEEPYVCTRPDDNGCWVSGSIRYELSSTSPYYHDIKEFQYRELGAIKWESIEASGAGTGSKLFSTANNTNYEQSSIRKDIKYRTIDTGNNISSEDGVHYIRIDNTVPVVTITPENGTFGNWSKDPLRLNLSAGNAPSGIFKYIVDDNGTITEIEATDSVATYTVNHNLNGTIKVKAISKTGIEGDYKESDTIKVDISKPTCSVTKVSDGTTAGVSLSVICTDEGGSGCSNQNYTGVKSTTTYTVTDGAGNTGTCTATISGVTYTQNRTRSCNTWARCSSAGCASYNSCSNAACGCASYSMSGCCYYMQNGVEFSNACSSGTYSSYSACSDAGSSHFGDCGSGGSFDFNCTCSANKTCQTSACGCAYYNRSEVCGCEVFSGWSGWSGWSATGCSDGTYRECNSEVRYFLS